MSEEMIDYLKGQIAYLEGQLARVEADKADGTISEEAANEKIAHWQRHIAIEQAKLDGLMASLGIAEIVPYVPLAQPGIVPEQTWQIIKANEEVKEGTAAAAEGETDDVSAARKRQTRKS